MPQQDIEPERFARLLEQIEGLKALELQGEGEPLMHPGFFQMVDLARQHFPAVEISMITNGSLFTAENINRILDHGIARIFVSVESVKDGEFQRIRGGKLDKVRRGIRALLQARNERGLKHPLIGLSVTALKSTVPELATGIPAFYRELQMDGGINIQALQASPQYARIYDEEMRSQIPDQQANRDIHKAISSSTALQSALEDRAKLAHVGFYEQLFGSVDTRFNCPWLSNGLYMATGGELVPCCHVKDYQKHAMATADEGAAAAEVQRASMRKQLASGEIPQPCSECPIGIKVARNSRKMKALLKSRLNRQPG